MKFKKKINSANLISGADNKANHMLLFQGLRNLKKETLNKIRQESKRHFRQRRQQSTQTEARKCLATLRIEERGYGCGVERKRHRPQLVSSWRWLDFTKANTVRAGYAQRRGYLKLSRCNIGKSLETWWVDMRASGCKFIELIYGWGF